jgi:hypothetical protein
LPKSFVAINLSEKVPGAFGLKGEDAKEEGQAMLLDATEDKNGEQQKGQEKGGNEVRDQVVQEEPLPSPTLGSVEEGST